MGDLRPCPFCGGEVVPFHAKSDELQMDLGYRFFCKNDCCMQVRFYKTKQEAVAAWNTRIDYEGEKTVHQQSRIIRRDVRRNGI